MNILVLGSGGREHTLSWKISKSPRLGKLFIAPGNAGTEQIGTNVDLNINDFDQVGEFCVQNDVKMLVVGPEEPLVRGIADHFKSNAALASIMVIGPSKSGAQLEGSKDFSKQFMGRHNIPTAAYRSFEGPELEAGQDFLATLNPPYVLKADGLAAGKGVLILNDLSEAQQELSNMLGGKFGEAGNRVVIEEFLDGIEFSVFVLTDGKEYIMLPQAKDYKRIGEGDTGLNTGGMGAVSPVPFVDEQLMEKVRERIVEPTVKGLSAEGMDYKGFVFFGLIRVQNEPYVIEYNVRMGDPETEVVIPRIESDLVDLLEATAKGELANANVEIAEQYATTVMAVSEGYPGSYEKGKRITGLEKIANSTVFHAGTKTNESGIVTNGGRVMAITSMGDTMQQALEKSYDSLKEVCYEGIAFRTDIGFDL